MNRREFTKSMAALLFSSRLPGPREVSTEPSSPEYFNVKDFGAIGNGLSDDTAAFERALLRATRAGGTVIVPAGRFPISRTLRLGDDVAIRGTGLASIIDHRAGEPIVMLAVDVKKAAVRDLSFTGTFAFAILVEGSQQITIANCHISGGNTPWLSSAFCGGIFLTKSDNVRVENNDLFGNGRIAKGILSSDIQVNGFGDGVYTYGIHIIRNRCTSTETQSSIAAYDLQDSVISDNTCTGAKTGAENNNGYGILIYQRAGSPDSCKNNTVSRNYVHSTAGTGIYLQKCHHSRVVQNTITDVASVQDDQTLPVGGIALNQSEYVSISRNRITRTGHAGISIASNRPNVGHVTVARNVIADVSGMGIHLRGQLTDIRVSGNTVMRTGGGIGGYSDDPQNQIALSDNTVVGTTGSSPGIILGNAASSTIRNNTVENAGGYGLAVTLRDSVSEVSGNRVSRSGQAFGGNYPNVRVVRSARSAPAK